MRIIFCSDYWNRNAAAHTVLPLATFAQIAQKIQSRFFTLDVARKRDGTWNIVEPGDGQVAGLPARADVEAFYQALGRL